MPINVTCPGCKTRFSVSEKYAGKEGPCPKCKTKIRVPAQNEEVVVHAPQEFGPKDAQGRPVLKPILRKETVVTPVMSVAVVGSILLVLIVAWLFRSPEGDVSYWLLSAGAVVLGPPLAAAGYSFLRNDELEPYRGSELWVRAGICGLTYALVWCATLLPAYVFALDKLELFHLMFLLPPMVVVAALVSSQVLDLDFGSAAIHYGLYLLATILLRAVVGLTLFPGLESLSLG